MKNDKTSTTSGKKISAVKTLSNKKINENKKLTAVNNTDEKKVTAKTKLKRKTTSQAAKKSSVNKTNAKIASKTQKAEPKRIFKLDKNGKKYIIDKKHSRNKKKILYFDKKIKLDLIDILTMIISTIIISCLVCTVTISLYYKNNSVVIDKDLAKDNDLQTFINTYSTIVDNFYEEVDKKGMVEAATSGMLEHLADKYSIYLNPDDAANFESTLNNTYEGIGILSVENVVYEVYPESPAEKAGIKEKDEIIQVNGVEINNKNYTQINTLIDEKDGESEIVIKRGQEKLTFNIAKAEVYKPAVDTNVLEKNGKKIGYISLQTFSQKSFEEFELKLYKLEEEDIESLIIDLRNNSGGYIDSAARIGSIFLEKGKIIYSLEKKNDQVVTYDETDESRDYKIVVLVNSSTASASEMLTGALKDNNDAIIIGTKTYGKGKVQTIMEHEGSLIKYTSSKWLRPNGECIDEVGIIPDYVVQNEVKNNVIYDKQYDKAIELLSKK